MSDTDNDLGGWQIEAMRATWDDTKGWRIETARLVRNDAQDWRTEAVRAVWKAVGSSSQTARLAALLLTVTLATVAMTWVNHEVSTADTHVQVTVTVTNAGYLCSQTRLSGDGATAAQTGLRSVWRSGPGDSRLTSTNLGGMTLNSGKESRPGTRHQP
jgi:hypothetical protein